MRMNDFVQQMRSLNMQFIGASCKRLALYSVDIKLRVTLNWLGV